MHNDYTLFTRKVPSGKHVVYYAYDEDGKRLGPWTKGDEFLRALGGLLAMNLTDSRL
jgi:hypothetical protein